MRLFIDSSVFFAIADSETGAARELMRRAILQEIELVVSEYVLTETEDKLKAKRPKAAELFGYFRLNPFWAVENPTEKEINAARETTPDPDDVPIVAAAKKARVDALLSFDVKHLHRKSVEDYIGARVVKPEVIMQEIRAAEKQN